MQEDRKYIPDFTAEVASDEAIVLQFSRASYQNLVDGGFSDEAVAKGKAEERAAEHRLALQRVEKELAEAHEAASLFHSKSSLSANHIDVGIIREEGLVSRVGSSGGAGKSSAQKLESSE